MAELIGTANEAMMESQYLRRARRSHYCEVPVLKDHLGHDVVQSRHIETELADLKVSFDQALSKP